MYTYSVPLTLLMPPPYPPICTPGVYPGVVIASYRVELYTVFLCAVSCPSNSQPSRNKESSLLFA